MISIAYWRRSWEPGKKDENMRTEKKLGRRKDSLNFPGKNCRPMLPPKYCHQFCPFIKNGLKKSPFRQQ